jgi:hypothetical protein
MLRRFLSLVRTTIEAQDGGVGAMDRAAITAAPPFTDEMAGDELVNMWALS